MSAGRCPDSSKSPNSPNSLSSDDCEPESASFFSTALILLASSKPLILLASSKPSKYASVFKSFATSLCPLPSMSAFTVKASAVLTVTSSKAPKLPSSISPLFPSVSCKTLIAISCSTSASSSLLVLFLSDAKSKALNPLSVCSPIFSASFKDPVPATISSSTSSSTDAFGIASTCASDPRASSFISEAAVQLPSSTPSPSSTDAFGIASTCASDPRASSFVSEAVVQLPSSTASSSSTDVLGIASTCASDPRAS